MGTEVQPRLNNTLAFYVSIGVFCIILFAIVYFQKKG